MPFFKLATALGLRPLSVICDLKPVQSGVSCRSRREISNEIKLVFNTIYSFALLQRQTRKKRPPSIQQPNHVRRIDYLLQLLPHLGADYRRSPDAVSTTTKCHALSLESNSYSFSLLRLCHEAKKPSLAKETETRTKVITLSQNN